VDAERAGVTQGRPAHGTRRVGVWLVCCLVLGTPLYMGESCGFDGGDKEQGEPCTRATECLAGLDCVSGVCREPADAAPPDAGE